MSTARWLRLMVFAAAGAAVALARAQTLPTTAPDPNATLKDSAVGPNEREEAARRLLQTNTEESRKAVLSALIDISNRTSQLAAARALATQPNPDPQFIIPLGALIGNDPQLTQAAIDALMNYRGNSDVRSRLIDVARRDTHEYARLAAIGALGSICDKPAASSLMELLAADTESPAVHRAAAAALVDMTGLADNGRNVARWQQWWAANSNKDDAQFQNELLSQQAAKMNLAEVRRARLAEAVRALLTQQYQSAPDAAAKEGMLLDYLRNAEPEIRSVGAKLVMEDFNSGRPVLKTVKEQLRQMVGDSSADVRASVAKALAAINYPPAFDALLSQLATEKDDAARTAQLGAVVARQDLRAVDTLLKLLHDPSPGIAEAAANGLKELAPLIRDNPELAKKVAAELRALLDERGAAPQDIELRAALIQAVAPLRVAELRGTFVRLLRPSEPPALRRAGLRALGELHDPGAADVIVDSLEDPDTSIRLEAVAALQTTAKLEQAEKLYQRTKPGNLPENEPDEQVRQRAWDVLSNLLPDALPDQLYKWAERFKDEPERRVRVFQTLREKLIAEKNLPQLALVQQNIGAEEMKLKQYDLAIPAFNAALEFYSSKPDYQANLDELLGQKMDALLLSKQYDKAATFAAESISRDKLQSAQQTMGPKIRKKIEDLRNDDKLEEARDLIDAANKMNPPLDEPSRGQIRNIEDDVKKKLASRPKQSGLAPREQPAVSNGQ